MLFLLFQLGNDNYALEAAQVAEVLPLVDIKRIPLAPAGVAGIINYRNAPVPVVDLSALMLGVPAPARLSTRIVLVHYPVNRGDMRLLGLIAERATETVRCDPSDFVPPGITNESTSYLGPVAPGPRGMIQRIELKDLLSEPVWDLLLKEQVEV